MLFIFVPVIVLYNQLMFSLLLVTPCTYVKLAMVHMMLNYAVTRLKASFLLILFHFLFSYIWSGLIVVIGIYLNVYSKNRAAWDAKFKEWIKKLCPQHRRLIALQNLQHII